MSISHSSKPMQNLVAVRMPDESVCCVCNLPKPRHSTVRRRISRFLSIMLWVLCIPALAQTHGDRSPCLTCHSEAMTQPKTQMGRAFAFSESNPVLGTH